MPCYRCGVRQVDPVRGHSPWQRGVRGDQQVLICPDCQSAPDLAADLDRCRQCGSVRLVRRLGEAECRACGFVVPPDGGPVELPGAAPAGPGGSAPVAATAQAVTAQAGGSVLAAGSGLAEPAGPADGGGAPGLAEEVSQALERVFGRSGAKPPASAVTP
jgi:hypothetical protein